MIFNKLLYSFSRPLGGLKVAKFLSRKHPKILMYHRISEDSKNVGLTEKKFRKQIKIIKKYFAPMTLQDLLSDYEKGCVPHNAVVVTFDDGYSDFEKVAFPILKKEGVPATLFITTGFVNGDLWLWPDKVDFLLSGFDSSYFSSLVDLFPSLNVSDSRKAVWGKICDNILELKKTEQELLLNNVSNILKVEIPNSPPDKYRAVNWNSLRNMVGNGLNVENHSYSHPILSRIDRKKIKYEVSKSKNLIFKNLGVRSSIFCYPNGMSQDYSQDVKEILETEGYKYSVTAFPKVRPLCNPMEIGRYPVSNSHSSFIKMLYGMSYLGMRFSENKE